MSVADTSRLPWTRVPPGAVRLQHLQHLRDPLGHFDLEAMERELRTDPAFEAEGHCAVTLAKYPDLRVVLVSMRKGARLGDTGGSARLCVQQLRGQAILHLAEGTLHLGAGHLATLDHEMPLELEAASDGAVLLTLAWPGAGAAAQA